MGVGDAVLLPRSRRPPLRDQPGRLSAMGRAERFPGGRDRRGVFPIQWLEAAAEEGVIRSASPIPKENFQPASLDLRLGGVAYRLQSSFLPSRTVVEGRLEALAMDQIDLRGEGGVLETNRPYLIPLLEELALPDDVR